MHDLQAKPLNHIEHLVRTNGTRNDGKREKNASKQQVELKKIFTENFKEKLSLCKDLFCFKISPTKHVTDNEGKTSLTLSFPSFSFQSTSRVEQLASNFLRTRKENYRLISFLIDFAKQAGKSNRSN